MLENLLLPLRDLVRMQLILGAYLPQSFILPECFKGHLSFELRRELPSALSHRFVHCLQYLSYKITP